ncbi:succinyl-CoA synthetase-like protein [Truncatella angustata]|uniref:Succinyl-CoA synthetase-like protein n=1 Tax=Truncatella angustata TaxID=152316 RepID=A0A9P9A4U8_9PEZI|nr:succinyl-CoA synthetase-like protein [Truncatella angustata]KAH6660244.1 succinyl-CoA synthetase-like protein [Truncatella angustata]
MNMISRSSCAPLKLPRFTGTYYRSFSSTRPPRNYDSTLKNLKIGKHTRVIFQGFTGRQATANAKESLEWGTNIVGGVTPGRGGEHLGLPVLPSVRKAMEVLKPDATGIYVAAHQATGAIEEAIEAEVPLIVVVAEHIPVHDFFRIHSVLKTQSASRLVGANSPGIISAVGKCRIGFQPLPCFEPGKVGIVARSGTLSYETAASTLRCGLGQSLSIGVGGDILPGTTLTDGLRVLAEDEDTKCIALVGEVGGIGELEAAEWIKEYRTKEKIPKPIVALVGGIQAVPGRIMGHAGAFALPGEPTAAEKIEALREAGATIINHPSRFGSVLKAILNGSMLRDAGVARSNQRRSMHTHARKPQARVRPGRSSLRDQRRSIYLTQQTALDLLRVRNIPVSEAPLGSAERLLAISINRGTRNPCIVASSTNDAKDLTSFDFEYTKGPASLPLDKIAAALHLSPNSGEHFNNLSGLVRDLVSLFMEKEAFLLETRVLETATDGIAVSQARLGFDDAALRSGKRHSDIHALRDLSKEDPAEVGVEKDGIAYVKLKDGNIGTLVNGAGLAMNTVDALADAGGRAANFLDTGGKATSETVKRSFEVILTDSRVKCIFVNIFGGLTLGDMIAQGVVMAFKDLEMSVPIVVRIRGTNEKEGQKIIAESGLPLYAFDDFDEAAAKAIELVDKS